MLVSSFVRVPGISSLPGRLSSTTCRNGSNGYPSQLDFQLVINNHVRTRPLITKKETTTRGLLDKRTAVRIVNIWYDKPEASSETNEFVDWAKFHFSVVSSGNVYGIILRKEQQLVALREDIYDIIMQCHQAVRHGGRDKTHNTIQDIYTFLPKVVVSDFLDICPTCMPRRHPSGPNLAITSGVTYHPMYSSASILTNSFANGLPNGLVAPTPQYPDLSMAAWSIPSQRFVNPAQTVVSPSHNPSVACSVASSKSTKTQSKARKRGTKVKTAAHPYRRHNGSSRTDSHTMPAALHSIDATVGHGAQHPQQLQLEFDQWYSSLRSMNLSAEADAPLSTSHHPPIWSASAPLAYQPSEMNVFPQSDSQSELWPSSVATEDAPQIYPDSVKWSQPGYQFANFALGPFDPVYQSGKDSSCDQGNVYDAASDQLVSAEESEAWYPYHFHSPLKDTNPLLPSSHSVTLGSYEPSPTSSCHFPSSSPTEPEMGTFEELHAGGAITNQISSLD